MPNPPSHSLTPDEERSLVDRARSGDQDAMGALYDAYSDRLYRYCLTRVGDETEAEDLAEDVFLKVLGAIDRFEWRPGEGGQRIPFGAWLFRIARNEIASYRRRAASRPRTAELPADLPEVLHDTRRGPAELAETKLTIEEVFRAVRELPDAQREVILLRFASGLTVAETAAALGKKVPNVKVLQHKGVQRLRAIFVASETPRASGR
ncbi:MAG: sigma-70 family RNA polymerase sigma factor [Chloroflexi bacterium]|nr:sigma-70 family RNA polymerase sigma factor [Chloroflexota bacterium]